MYGMERHRSHRFIGKKDVIAYSFLLPFLVLFIVFTLYPAVSGLYVSLTDYNVLQPVKNFVGLANYEELLTSGRFFRSLKNTGYYTLLVIPGQVIIGLALALYVNMKLWGHTFSRVVIFAPYVLSVSVTSFIWGWILETNYGLLNLVLGAIGLGGNIPWLTSRQWAMPGIAITSVWGGVGFTMIMFLAGLQDIPSEVREAAKVDGANRWQIFLFVVLPMLRSVIMLVITLGLINGMKVFGQMYIMTQGGPGGITKSVVYEMLDEFGSMRMGYSAAIGYTLTIIILVLTLVRQSLVRES